MADTLSWGVMICLIRVTFFFVRGVCIERGFDKYLHPFLIIMPDLSVRISIHSVNVLVRGDIAFAVDASLHSIFGFYDALNILGH